MARSSFYSDSSDEDNYDPRHSCMPTTSYKLYDYSSPQLKRSANYYKLLSRRKSLPIWQYKDPIIKLIKNTQVLLFDGETGSGKSTQIPQWCLEINKTIRVVCVQPRRIAAISLAQRVAQEMDVYLGEEVGYAVRFDHYAGPKTALTYVTDGILLRHAMTDNRLSSYDVIILDEVHERRLISDILLGVVKDVLLSRPDVRVIIMSATLNIKQFCEFFDDCPHMHIPGKTYPIDIIYSPKVLPRAMFNNFDKKRFPPYVFDAINVILEICLAQKTEGDILVFVTGRDEIDFICQYIEFTRVDYMDSMLGIEVIPLYADLPYSRQQRIFTPSPKSAFGHLARKCIVSTNIAESAITIEGIGFIVDTGKVKLSSLVENHVKSLLPVDISQSSADQRAGRAGRTQPGKCYRLYSESSFLKLARHTVPEILRIELTSTILNLKTMGIELTRFELIDQPSLESINLALSNLKQLGAINSQGDVTVVGKQMSKFPLEADIARMLIASQKYNCQQDIITLAAVLSGDRPGGVFLIEKDDRVRADQAKASLSHPSGDHLTYINVYNKFRASYDQLEWCRDNYVNYQLMLDASHIRQQITQTMLDLYLMRINSKYSSSVMDNTDNILKAVLSGVPGNIAMCDKAFHYKGLRKQGYTIFNDGIKVTLHPSSTLDAKSSSYSVVCYNTCIQTNPKSYFICVVSNIQGEWLQTSSSGRIELITDVPTSPKIEKLYISRYANFSKKS
ncbi:Pre-mRNA-splicing factor ATP-dependent RNA helicase DHX15-like isoform X2 [Oopsacas minuta]|uniref:RNA helicase n=1 Tax=Oopsacas minuta TaxID=111878 RepID=A0AAV7JM49_9METZ|nr:Pre-mRNA-splicing factor ATP-dependent RNA helicase DHX15-like isoform X2 [Oopsacas minuta]